MKLDKVQFRPPIAILGESGSGKTYQLGSLCQLLPTVIIGSDLEGFITLRKMGAAPVEVIHIQEWEAAWDCLGEVKAALRNGARAVGVDDFGASQEVMRRKAMMMPRSKLEERMKGADREALLRKEFLLGNRHLQFQGFQELAEGGRDFLWELRQLPFQLLMVNMLEGVRPDPRSGEDRLFPELEGNIRKTILARFSLVVEVFRYWEKEEELWCATTRSHPRTNAKDRVGTARTWIAPTAAKLLLHITGKEGASELETELERRIGTGLRI